MNNLVFVFVLVLSSAFADPIVNLPDGKIRGYESRTVDQNRKYYAFKGIPFAAPPIGPLRFQSPVLPEPWSGILNATEFGNSCYFFYTIPGDADPGVESEDCLFLNVFTPIWNDGQLLPVMVYIYGGGYVSGTSTFYGPDAFLDENVVVVTLNYRLASFGFLSTEDLVIPGNAGFKDQLLALKWVNKNIELFGGNPKKVTIFGESAGAISVALHTLSEKSKGLFYAGISQSGGTLLDVLYRTNAKSVAYLLANLVDNGISAQFNTTMQIRNLLLSQSADVLVSATQQLDPTFYLFTYFGSVIEVNHEDAFLTNPNFYNLLESGSINQTPLMIGSTEEEALFILQDLPRITASAESFDNDVTLLLPAQLRPVPGSDLREIGEKIKYFYVGNDTFSNDLTGTVKYCDDNFFIRPILKDVQLRSKYSDVYLYQFTYYGTNSQWHNLTVDGIGKVRHTDELGYLFNIAAHPISTEADYRTRRRLVKLWTNFAKTRNPTPKRKPLLQNVKWPTASPTNIKYLNIGSELVVEQDTRINILNFWTDIWNTYGTKPYTVF